MAIASRSCGTPSLKTTKVVTTSSIGEGAINIGFVLLSFQPARTGKITDMSQLPPVAQTLTGMAIPYRLFRHQGQIASLEQAAAERGQQPGQVVRSLLFRLGEGNFVMVLIAGPAQVSWPALRAYLGQSRLSMASEEEVLSVTGYRIGAVSPLGLPGPIRILADENVFFPEEVSIGSGERGTAVILKSADLRSSIDTVETGKFASDK
jgi:prolyl-tRNA editing enzyme YbaK/EbsC (Cys-tRNA(Pro) deacylase)